MSGTEGQGGPPTYDFGGMAASAVEVAENMQRMSDVTALFAQAVAAAPLNKRAGFGFAGLMMQVDFLLRSMPPDQREAAAQGLLSNLASLAERTLPNTEQLIDPPLG